MPAFTVMPHEVGLAIKAITTVVPNVVVPHDRTPRVIYDGVSQLTVSDEIADRIRDIMAADWRGTGLKLVLHEEADKVRAQFEVITIRVGAATAMTDLASRHLLMELFHVSQFDTSKIYHWKCPDGSIAAVRSAEIADLTRIASTHAQKCLRTASEVRAAIEAGTIINSQQINDAFAAIR